MAQRTSRAVRAAALAILGLLLSGCTVPPERTTALDRLPTGISVDVYQSRIDGAEHKLEVAVTNHSDLPFEVLGATFSSPAFPPAVDYTRAPTTVRPGTTTDLRVLLPPADCAATPGQATVGLHFVFDGVEGEAEVSANDRMGQLATVAAEDCRDEVVAEVASIEPAPQFTPTTIDGRPAALLDFVVTPTGNGGTLTIDNVRGSPLVSLRDPHTGVVGETVPLELDIGRATTPTTFTLTLMAARCDPHVVLEDKRGTFFTFTVTTRQDTGVIFIGVDDTMRGALYDFVASACGWPAE